MPTLTNRLQWSTLNRHIVGTGEVTEGIEQVRLYKGPTSEDTYSNAQLDDTQRLQRANFCWRPPLCLTVRARFSHDAQELSGTAGFGFWNDPFMMTEKRKPTLPTALWFFFSAQPSNMALALDVPGWGWKAATIDAWQWPFFLLAPTAPIGILLMRIPRLYRWLWPLAQSAIGVREALLAVNMRDWHTYRLVWQKSSIDFFVDNNHVLHSNHALKGPLGLVIWFDNQAMVVTPQGQVRHCLVTANKTEWMEISEVTITD